MSTGHYRELTSGIVHVAEPVAEPKGCVKTLCRRTVRAEQVVAAETICRSCEVEAEKVRRRLLG